MQAASISECGSRQHNEDAIYFEICQTEACFAVADGLGGHGFGEIASQEAIRLFRQDFNENHCKTAPSSVICAVHACLLELQKERHLPYTMLTTAVFAQIFDMRLRYAHVGDSRLYLFRDGQLFTRTKDHSVTQMLAACGEISEEEIRGHPDRNRLLQAAGMPGKELRPDEKELELLPEDAILLCSDGFWEAVTEQNMLECLKQANDVWNWLARMNEQILSRKTENGDNYSAVGVWIT